MERKSGSSSRSPSLSRRPSLKDKKPSSSLSKTKKKAGPGGAKKERWLLTRKTWRYMTDAVGNLLPEVRGGSRRGSNFPTTSSPPPNPLQEFHSKVSPSVGGGISSPPLRSPTSSSPSTATQVYSLQRNPSNPSKPGVGASGSLTSPTGPSTCSVFPWGSFPSHRPGVTPTGPGPGGLAQGQSMSFNTPSKNPRHPAHPIDPEDYPAIEKHFNDVCTKEKRFLLWNRTKPKGLSGPALREHKMKTKEQSNSGTAPSVGGDGGVGRQSSIKSLFKDGSSSSSKGFFHNHQLFQRNASVDVSKDLSPEYYSPEEEFDVEEDDYDEYDNDEEQVTVCERRKSSTASSTMSILGGAGGGGSSFFRPLSTVSNCSGNSDTSYAMITLSSGLHKILRNTGIQTDPFPEELLLQLRLHEERQRVYYSSYPYQTPPQGLPFFHPPSEDGQESTHDRRKEVLIPISTSSVTSTSSPKSDSGRESEEKVLDNKEDEQQQHEYSALISDIDAFNTSSRLSSLHDTSLSSNVTGPATTTTASSSSSGITTTTTTGGNTTTEEKKGEESSGYSSSISDTVMRYLRMVRKNSKADNKETIDKFKTVNYDRSLRYIKSKNVTVEEALEHEKNKALGLGGPSSSSTSPLPPDLPPSSQQQGKGQSQKTPTNNTSLEGLLLSPSTVTSETTTTTLTSRTEETTTRIVSQVKVHTKNNIPLTGEDNTGAPVDIIRRSPPPPSSSSRLQASSSSSSPPTSPQSTSSPPVDPTKAPVDELPSKKGKGKKSDGKKKASKPTPSSSSTIPTTATTTSQLTPDFSDASPPSSPPPMVVVMCGGGGAVAAVALNSPPPPPPPPKEVGIQAGESLVRLLKSLAPRKFSEVSSTTSYSSESPLGDTTSPRYSIATTVFSSTSDPLDYPLFSSSTPFYLLSSSDQGQHSSHFTSSPRGGRSSFDTFSTEDGGTTEQQQQDIEGEPFVHFRTSRSGRDQQQQQQQHYRQSSSSANNDVSEGTPTPVATASSSSSSSWRALRSLSSSTVESSTLPGTTTFSFSQQILSQIPLSSSSSRHSSTNNPAASNLFSPPPHHLSTSSHHHHHTPHHHHTHHVPPSSSLVRSFFSTSFFKKPPPPVSSSTTSLLLSPSSPRLSLGPSSPLPPTTSSSPNLLSLVSNTNTSSGSSTSQFLGSSSSSRLFRSSRGEVTSSPSIANISSSGGVGGGGSGGSRTSVSFKGSLVPQKGLMSLPVSNNDNNNLSSTVMHKSKSSSSVLPQLHGDRDHRPPSSSSTHSNNPATSSSSALPHSAAVAPSPTTSSGGGGGGGPASSASRLMSKSSRIFKSRSKSSTRANTSSTGSSTCLWAPQGKCKWKSPTGRTLTLEATSILALSEVERTSLQELALDKIKALSLGVDVKIPKENKGGGVVQKPKRRPYLLKKKALSTGFFESGAKRDDPSKESINPGSGAVFGISLSQCVANDRLKGIKSSGADASADLTRKRSQNGSRSSLSSVTEPTKEEPKGSSESLFWGKRPSLVPVDSLSPAGDVLGESLQPPPKSVPAIVTACVNHLENYGLHTTGIFRVSTSLKRIRQLREEIDGGKEIKFSEEHSPHDVAALLKEFLRDLPEPLLSRELYQAFLKTQRIRNRKQQLEAVQHLIQLLPVPNRDTLASLLSFFAKVVANAGDTRTMSGEVLSGNKMEGYSLATLIAPNILPCMPSEGSLVTPDSTLTKERRESIDVVNYLISNYKLLFEVSPELLHDVYLHLMDTQPESVEALLKLKAPDEPGDEVETSSVFEGSECGELAELDEQQATIVPTTTTTTTTTPRVFRRREEVTHEGAVRGSLVGSESVGGGPSSSSSSSRLERTRERVRGGKRERSKDRDVQSGAESDSSSTKSSSRWFRRTRGGESKTRTSSDSGSERTKGRDSSLAERHRASSLDSVNPKEGGGATEGGERICESLRVPVEPMSRRQSSPVLERSGIITASLKIPVPLNIDDTDIPFIEDDELHPHGRLVQRSRGRSASTDSSAVARSPISGAHKQTSSEMSSPPGSPTTFPYEEMTARILIGAPSLPVSSSLSTITTSVSTSSDPSKVLHTQTESPPPFFAPQEPKGLGKETKGANIGGLIKSKTADFEKLAKISSTSTGGATQGPSAISTTTSSSSSSSIAPKMRLRSQENIVLKQQFLLRQQQQGEGSKGGSSGAGVKRSDSKTKEDGERPSTSSGQRSLQRRRHIMGSASSSAILPPLSSPSASSKIQSQPISVTVRSSNIGGTTTTTTPSQAVSTVGAQQGSSTTQLPSSPSRWKRSEIIASRQDSHNKSTDPETFV